MTEDDDPIVVPPGGDIYAALEVPRAAPDPAPLAGEVIIVWRTADGSAADVTPAGWTRLGVASGHER